MEFIIFALCIQGHNGHAQIVSVKFESIFIGWISKNRSET